MGLRNHIQNVLNAQRMDRMRELTVRGVPFGRILINLYPADSCLGLDVGEERSREYPDPDLSFVKSLTIIFKGCRPFSQSDVPPQTLRL